MREQASLTREGPYASALADVARDLGHTLARLDALAASPSSLAEGDHPAELSALQYRLHVASETLLALAAPADAVLGVADFAEALVAARESTGSVARAVDRREPLGSLVYEWRGALFRVRVAREEAARAPESPRSPIPWGRIQGVLLLLCAIIAVAVGAHAEAWPVVAGGGAAVALSVRLILRP